MHASEVELLRCADPKEPVRDEHMVACADCAETAEGLRRGRLALLGAVSDLDAVGPECLDEQAVAALVEGGVPDGLRDAYVSHLSRCAVCRTAVSSVALARSSEHVVMEISALERRRSSRWLYYAAPLGAAAALLLLLRPPAGDDSSLHRGAPVAAQAPLIISPSGSTEAARVLRWHAVRGADRYRVTLFREDGGVLFETTLSDTLAAVPDGLELATGAVYYWIVAARIGFDRWETSGLAEFSIPELSR